MKTKTLQHGGALLCLLALLTSCGTSRAPIVRTETVTVEKPVIVGVPAELTRQEAEPQLPAGVVSNDDLVDLIDRLRAWGRSGYSKLRKIAGLAPKDGAP